MSGIEIHNPSGTSSGGGTSGGLADGGTITTEKTLEWGKAYRADASAGSFKAKLPAATGAGGKTLDIKITPNSGAGTVTLEAHAGELINSEEASLILSLANAFSAVTLVSVANNPEVY